MRVELQQIVGKPLGSPNGPDIPTDAYFVRVDMRSLGYDQDDMKQVGTICSNPNAAVNFIKRLPVAIAEQIVEEVRKLRSVSTKNEYGMVPPLEHLEAADDDNEDFDD